MAITGDVHIKVNSEALVSKAESVSKSMKRMADCFEDMERIINRTGYYWIGEAGDGHRRLYQAQKTQIEEMMTRLREHPDDLMAIARVYDTAESAVRSMASELPGDVIN